MLKRVATRAHFTQGIVALSAIALPRLVHAAEQNASDQASGWVTALILWGPAFLLLLLLWAVFRKSVSRQKGYLAKADEHMARMEQKTDRMIALLESIERKLEAGS